MAQKPLTKEGVAGKQAELYALSQQELNYQSDLIRNDFKNWMSANFALTPDEEISLRTMVAEVGFFLGVEIGGAVQLKRPIYLQKDPKTVDHGSKRVDIRGEVDGTLDPNVPSTPNGSLSIHIYYVP